MNERILVERLHGDLAESEYKEPALIAVVIGDELFADRRNKLTLRGNVAQFVEGVSGEQSGIPEDIALRCSLAHTVGRSVRLVRDDSDIGTSRCRKNLRYELAEAVVQFSYVHPLEGVLFIFIFDRKRIFAEMVVNAQGSKESRIVLIYVNNLFPDLGNAKPVVGHAREVLGERHQASDRKLVELRGRLDVNVVKTVGGIDLSHHRLVDLLKVTVSYDDDRVVAQLALLVDVLDQDELSLGRMAHNDSPNRSKKRSEADLLFLGNDSDKVRKRIPENKEFLLTRLRSSRRLADKRIRIIKI